jgi:glycine/D-amino acid oxidase-like deaminating enzyme
VHAHAAILCAGPESQAWLKAPVARLRVGYAFTSAPSSDEALPRGTTLVTHGAEGVLVRSTPDARLLVAGEVPTETDLVAERDLPLHVTALAQRLTSLTGREAPPVASAWSGNFAQTEDGLPRIGAVDQRGRLFVALTSGANGLLQAAQAGGVLVDLLRGRAHPLADLYTVLDRRGTPLVDPP